MARDFTNNASNYITKGSDAALTLSSFSIVCRVLKHSNNSVDGLVAHGDENANGCYRIATLSNGQIQYFVGNWPGDYWAISGSTISDTNTWHALGLTFESDTLTGYFDGASDGTNTGGTTFTPTDREFRIGFANRLGGYEYPADAAIADVAIWDVVLTAAEMVSYAKGQRPTQIRPESLVAFWPLIGKSSPEPEIIKKLEGTITGTVNAYAHSRIVVPRRRIIQLAPAGGAPSGTAALALSRAIVSASGVMQPAGQAALTLAKAALAASGAQSIPGSATVLLSNATIAAAAEEAISGSAGLVLANAVLAANGIETITGSAALALAKTVLAASGSSFSGISGTAALQLAAVQIAVAAVSSGLPPSVVPAIVNRLVSNLVREVTGQITHTGV